MAALLNWIGIAGGVIVAVSATAVMHMIATARARAIEGSASEQRVHELRVALARIRVVAALCGAIAGYIALLSAVWHGVSPGPAAIAAVAAVACLVLPPSVAGRPLWTALARARGIEVKAMRSYRGMLTRVIGIAVLAAPVLVALASTAAITARVAILAIGYLAITPVLGGLLAPACVRILGPGALPVGLQARLTSLAGQAGAQVRGRVIKSRARKMAGAVQMGWIPGLRYVLITDYLLDELTQAQVDAVLVHELAHARHHDVVVRQLIGSAAVLPMTMTLVALISNADTFALIMAFISVATYVGFLQLRRTGAIRQELAGGTAIEDREVHRQHAGLRRADCTGQHAVKDLAAGAALGIGGDHRVQRPSPRGQRARKGHLVLLQAA